MKKYWIGVASKDHVKLGESGGFCQLCHGKKAPLARMNPGDQILYYAPKESLKTGIPYQKIIACGTIKDDTIYQVEMNSGFIPYRRDVLFEKNLSEVPLYELKEIPNWQVNSSKLRFGHFEITQNLYEAIYACMKSK